MKRPRDVLNAPMSTGYSDSYHFMARGPCMNTEAMSLARTAPKEETSNGFCLLNAETDGYCPDSCYVHGLPVFPMANLLPFCSIAVSVPNGCNPSLSCESPVGLRYGPIELTPGGSYEMNCLPDWSRCMGQGCITLELSLSVPLVPIDIPLAELAICIAINPLPECGTGSNRKAATEAIYSVELTRILFPIRLSGTLSVFDTTPSSYFKTQMEGGRLCQDIHAFGTNRIFKVLGTIRVWAPFVGYQVVHTGYILEMSKNRHNNDLQLHIPF